MAWCRTYFFREIFFMTKEKLSGTDVSSQVQGHTGSGSWHFLGERLLQGVRGMGREHCAAFQNRAGCEQSERAASLAEWIIKQTARWQAAPTPPPAGWGIIHPPVVRRIRKKSNWAWLLAISQYCFCKQVEKSNNCKTYGVS